MPALAVGALQVSCPHCRAVTGRPCVDARGYLYEGGVHVTRRQAWLELEARDG